MKLSKIIIVCFIASSAIFNACQKDMLEKYPLDQVSSADFMKQPNDLKIYMNQFYNDELFPAVYGQILNNPYRGGADDFDSDNQINGASIDTRLQGLRTVSYVGRVTWDYSYVRKINYFFDNYKKCTGDFKYYQQYVGEAYFFRALIYFQLMQTFGDVPLLTTTLQTNSPELYEPKTPRNIVADKIISDLDSAAIYLSDVKNDGCSRISKWIALAFQTRVALYEGTWEKYHATDAFKVSTPQPEKYFNKVVDAATTMMNSGKFDIYSTGNPTSDYVDLFNLRNYSTNNEVLFWKKFSTALSINNNRNYSLEYPNNRSITKELADAYLCSDGKPIAGNPLFSGYNSITDEMKNRDPRFYQTIFTPDATWMIDASGTKYWTDVYAKLNSATNYNAPSGYVSHKGYDPLMTNHSLNYEETPSIYYRYAEVLLNFAEAKAELGTITQADIDISIKKLRDRVGMPNLNITSIVNDPKWDFPTLSPIINEIRRERRVELANEGFRWPDIARWAAADELIVGKRPKGFKGSQISSTVFPVDEDGFLDPFKVSLPSGYGFVLNRDYLNPIPQSELVLNPKLLQNPGWE
jgi:starch-binding outer membrane protein, SusD/RagB family